MQGQLRRRLVVAQLRRSKYRNIQAGAQQSLFPGTIIHNVFDVGICKAKCIKVVALAGAVSGNPSAGMFRGANLRRQPIAGFGDLRR